MVVGIESFIEKFRDYTDYMCIENTTVYDEIAIKEVVNVLTKRYKILIASCAGFLLGLACYFAINYSMQKMTLVLIPIIGAIVVSVLGLFKLKSYKEMIFQRLRLVNHQDNVQVKYDIDEEKILVKTGNGNSTLYHKDIKDIVETNIQYIIIYTGKAFILISKNGFNDNNECDFMSLIDKNRGDK